ncbi:acetyltransferase [Vibrio cholerae]|nr:hypothetical protein VCCP103710_3281 [Vibrio cholerae CP1037(10)]MVB48516.1 acetyltransferase [Vibrio cholerae]MVB59630.1 acetyltransferase [Vibrio cholerae]MVC35977.1 acetyltransferase [Vibrio cholerae]QHQ92423.1 acetyltransferase [Vibrio cholerae O1]
MVTAAVFEFSVMRCQPLRRALWLPQKLRCLDKQYLLFVLYSLCKVLFLLQSKWA